MRLTNSIRSSFVNAVMDDVPQIDYRTLQQTIAKEDAIAQMPEGVRALYQKDPEWFSNFGHYVEGTGYYYVPLKDGLHFTPAAVEKIRELKELDRIQDRERDELRSKLRDIAAGCTTKKTLVAALPEFEKYLPADPDGVNRLAPCIANVVTDFIKAGWPKDQPQPVEA